MADALYRAADVENKYVLICREKPIKNNRNIHKTYINFNTISFIFVFDISEFLLSMLPAFYDEQRLLPFNQESIEPVYRLESANWRGDKSDQVSINDERYEYGKSLNDVDEQIYPPRTRRYSFVDRYRNDDVEDTLANTKLPEDNSENLYNAQLLSADALQFLPDEKSPDYTLLKSFPDDEKDDEREYERVFSRKYKHRREQPRLEFLGDDARMDSAKRIKHEDLDYEDGETDDEALKEIEGSEIDDSDAKASGMYTDGGIEQSLKHKAASDAAGKFII